MNSRTEAIRILGVGGTWAKKHERDATQWYQKGSPLHGFLLRRGFSWLMGLDGRVFEWTTRLAGFHAWRRVVSWFTRKAWLPSLLDWEVAGANLYDYICPTLVPCEHWLPGRLTHFWLHSHAGNVGFFACAKGAKVNTFVTFCTPVRADMAETIKLARPHMGYWIHVYSDESDPIQIAGSIGDGDVNVIRKFSELRDEGGRMLGELGLGPDLEIFVEDGHSRLLNYADGFDRLDPILAITEARHGRANFLER